MAGIEYDPLTLYRRLNDAAASPNAEARRVWALVNFTATDEGVTAFRYTEGRHEINAKYLLGCDGANSDTKFGKYRK